MGSGATLGSDAVAINACAFADSRGSSVRRVLILCGICLSVQVVDLTRPGLYTVQRVLGWHPLHVAAMSGAPRAAAGRCGLLYALLLCGIGSCGSMHPCCAA